MAGILGRAGSTAESVERLVGQRAGRSTTRRVLAHLNHSDTGGYHDTDRREALLKRIVIIEDNAMAANIYQATLARQGFSVAVAADGELGLAAVVASPPDLILLDLMLPKIDGVELLRRIRATENLTNVPIIVISNAYTPARLESLREAGATKIVSKANMSPKQLVAMVEEFMTEGGAK